MISEEDGRRDKPFSDFGLTRGEGWSEPPFLVDIIHEQPLIADLQWIYSIVITLTFKLLSPYNKFLMPHHPATLTCFLNVPCTFVSKICSGQFKTWSSLVMQQSSTLSTGWPLASVLQDGQWPLCGQIAAAPNLAGIRPQSPVQGKWPQNDGRTPHLMAWPDNARNYNFNWTH